MISNEEDFLKKVSKEIFKNWYFVKIFKKLKNQIQKIEKQDEGFNVEY